MGGEIAVCHGCWAELVELRRMVIEELPDEGQSLTGFVAWRNALKKFAGEINLDHNYTVPQELDDNTVQGTGSAELRL